ncbi:MAG: hypothetical protein EPN79_11730 [Burkholderiaceae bacterium]|nr:MAG: hypothetical protein EPN79_11730 [Burkholderiaceae bacterium]TBR76673.1 MAG: hypothetical protein EPN64_05335 [Burkholderiaceae bacterium]
MTQATVFHRFWLPFSYLQRIGCDDPDQVRRAKVRHNSRWLSKWLPKYIIRWVIAWVAFQWVAALGVDLGFQPLVALSMTAYVICSVVVVYFFIMLYFARRNMSSMGSRPPTNGSSEN